MRLGGLAELPTCFCKAQVRFWEIELFEVLYCHLVFQRIFSLNVNQVGANLNTLFVSPLLEGVIEGKTSCLVSAHEALAPKLGGTHSRMASKTGGTWDRYAAELSLCPRWPYLISMFQLFHTKLELTWQKISRGRSFGFYFATVPLDIFINKNSMKCLWNVFVINNWKG